MGVRLWQSFRLITIIMGKNPIEFRKGYRPLSIEGERKKAKYFIRIAKRGETLKKSSLVTLPILWVSCALVIIKRTSKEW